MSFFFRSLMLIIAMDIKPDDEFSTALHDQAPRYDLQLSVGEVARLREYYDHVMAWNPRLHLVAPCSPVEFGTRHVLESLRALRHISEGAHVIDIGSGAGLPIVPCLIVRPDLRATLLESSPKKAVFLREALRTLGVHQRGTVIAERFEKIAAPEAGFVTCRALERFVAMLPRLVEWSPASSTLLLFGGDGLREEVERLGLAFEMFHIPQSQRRFLFVIKGDESLLLRPA